MGITMKYINVVVAFLTVFSSNALAESSFNQHSSFVFFERLLWIAPLVIVAAFAFYWLGGKGQSGLDA